MIIEVFDSSGKLIKQMTSPCRMFKGDYIKIGEKPYAVYSCVMVFDSYDEFTHQEICIKE